MAKKWLIGLFCAILGGSFLVFNVFSKQLSGDNHENRLLTTLPSVLQGPLSGLIARLDSFFVDNSPWTPGWTTSCSAPPRATRC